MDGAISKHHSSVGVGVVIRDDKGRVIAALSKRIRAPLGLLEAEAKAFEASFQFARDTGFQEFVLEGDLLVIVQALCGLSHPPSTVAPLILGM